MKNGTKKLLKVLIIVLVLASISVGLFFILKACGITDIEVLRKTIDSAGAWGWVVFIAIRVLLTIFLCFVPACSMLFDLLAVALYGANIKSFVICLISISICSFIMYLLGRFGANKFLEKIIGKEDLDKAGKLIKEKGIVLYPFMMVCGGFPDDALVCMAGVVKMNLLYFIICTVVGRAVGCACTIFGLSLIPFEKFNTIYDWLQFIAMVIVFIFVIIKVSNLLSKKINEMRKPKPLPKQIDLEKLEEHREQVESDNGSN